MVEENGDRRVRVAIAGGGLGGVLLAIGLQQHQHIDTHVYESAPSFGEIGAGVALGPNAQRALELIDPRAWAVLDRLSSTNMWDSHLHHYLVDCCAYGPRAGEIVCVQETPTPLRTVHRARLLEGLVELVDQRQCHFNKRLAGVEQSADGSGPVTLKFEDGTHADTDVLLGADGVRSTVRGYVLGEDHPARRPQYTGVVAYRGVVPMERAIARIGAEMAQNTYCHFGPGALTLSYPIERGALVNFVLTDFDHGGEVGEQWMWPVKAAEIRKKVEGFSDAVQGVVDLIDDPKLMAWAMFQHPNAPYYHKGSVAMMGDAAHAVTPFQGAGAGQAVEDALVLATLFGHVRDPAHAPRALAAYDQVRRPRKQRVCDTSLDIGRRLCMREPGVGDDIDKIKEPLPNRMHWLWNRDLKAQNDEVVRLFQESL